IVAADAPYPVQPADHSQELALVAAKIEPRGARLDLGALVLEKSQASTKAKVIVVLLFLGLSAHRHVLVSPRHNTRSKQACRICHTGERLSAAHHGSLRTVRR